jgi:monoamine oxidase
MADRHIIVVGAGVCGLYAATLLAEKGWKVTILEATRLAGGRVRTYRGVFGQPVEAGAEFLHGDAPITRRLARRTNSKIEKNAGRFFISSGGRIIKQKEPIPHMEEFMKAAGELKDDTTLDDFLRTRFGGDEFESLRRSTRKMAEGFDAADASRVSVKALYEEWSGQSMEEIAAIGDGYLQLVRFLTGECVTGRCDMRFNSEVKEIIWSPGKADVRCADGSVYTSTKVLLTVALGALLAGKEEKGHVAFVPELTNHRYVAAEMGYGAVVKIILEFNSRFWADERFASQSQQEEELGFLLNDTSFPVYWFHSVYPVVTAWAGGSPADQLKGLKDEALRNIAVSGLATSLGANEDFVKSLLVTANTYNWACDPFAKGAYSYTTPATANTKRVLKKPVANTLYFAGEALGKSHGTVEAALESAREVVRKIG